MRSVVITSRATYATRYAGRDVADTRTGRVGFLWGPLCWSRGRLFALVRMHDTGRRRWIRTDVLQLTEQTAR